MAKSRGSSRRSSAPTSQDAIEILGLCDDQPLPPSRSHTRRYLVLSVLAILISFFYKSLLASGRQALSTAPFNIIDIRGKGKGVVAGRDFMPGDLIMKEKALISVPSSLQGTSPSSLLRSAVDSLSPSHQDLFFSLSSAGVPNATPGSRDDQVVMAIFQTNAIAAGANAAIFPGVARLNHGCSTSFNAVYSWRAAEEILVVHALKPIKEGQEILTTYTDTKRPRKERQDYLLKHYGFLCSCSTCALSDEASRLSDDRLEQMRFLYRQLATWASGSISGLAASTIANEIWAVGELEGYVSERGQLAADVAHVAAAHSDAQGTWEWSELAAKWFTYELGADSLEVLQMKSVSQNPHLHSLWSSRPFEKIAKPLEVS